MEIEFQILNFIQTLRTPFLDAAMCFITRLGNSGMIWLVLAALIAFSRLYLYVHYPTDILGGILAGTAAGYLGCRLVNGLEQWRKNRHEVKR